MGVGEGPTEGGMEKWEKRRVGACAFLSQLTCRLWVIQI